MQPEILLISNTTIYNVYQQIYTQFYCQTQCKEMFKWMQKIYFYSQLFYIPCKNNVNIVLEMLDENVTMIKNSKWTKDDFLQARQEGFFSSGSVI